ncbi:hypothetical protein NITGR_430013 [Nitrospina gracilis 3/211]|uniref:Peptidase S1 domain-containing protein n=1 Tax=Nitrospina gracilis (strain 3/211) TaxID=1266370 RepID=M1YK41_NITG3|nr:MULTISPECIES: serine protease [Nitrospina]MCF8723746.1 hypothetical protein [Nitrospina sp. Nb-3]CCQ90846.1 hypothetical protein NITGR_430013 [Nitrospina gracilis 3/211]
MRDEEYFAIKERAARRFMKIPHVTAVGIGSKEKDGKPTGEIVIKVYVSKKKPAREVPADELIPPEFEGLPTDVVEMGELKPDAPIPGVPDPGSTSTLTDSSRERPLKGGIQISTESKGGAYGTLGCFLVDKNDSTAVYALTNHHVIAKDGKMSLSRRVEQPNSNTFTTADSIGLVAGGGDDSTRDAAIVRLAPQMQWLAEIKGIGVVKGMHTITVAEAGTGTYQVKKRGARTQLTGGTISSIMTSVGGVSNGIIITANPDPANPGTLMFFSAPGDSGSVYLNNNDEVVGLHFSGWHSAPLSSNYGKSGGMPIADVLRRFREVERIDLEVATAASLNSTQTVAYPAGAPNMAGADIETDSDHGYYRPLTGGSQILAAPMLGHMNTTTLGCMVKVTTEPDAAYALTCYRGVSANGTIPPTAETKIGQPDNEESCSGCCTNTFGKFSKGSANADRNAAIVKMDDGMKWLAEVLQIGYIKGIHTVTPAEVSSGTYQVRKRGAQSRLTGGVITAVGGVHGTLPAGVNANAMLIRPNPNPSRPGDDISFSHFGDRGAVVVNEDDKVVGLLYDEIEIPSGSSGRILYGVATPIQIVIDQFNSVDSVQITVATATQVDDVQTASNSSMVAVADNAGSTVFRPQPQASPVIFLPTREAAPVGVGAYARLKQDLSLSGTGRMIAAVWKKHQEEISHLIETNRRVATVWHRSGGPAILQALVRVFYTPSARVPQQINGEPLSDCIDRSNSIFNKYGSESLRRDLTLLKQALPDIAGMTYREILKLFEENAGVPELVKQA